jgi:hypothetical protein
MWMASAPRIQGVSRLSDYPDNTTHLRNNKMAVTELLFPPINQDAETQSQFKEKKTEIFSHFSGVAGLQSILHGTVIADDGTPVDPNSDPRNALLIGLCLSRCPVVL